MCPYHSMRPIYTVTHEHWACAQLGLQQSGWIVVYQAQYHKMVSVGIGLWTGFYKKQLLIKIFQLTGLKSAKPVL